MPKRIEMVGSRFGKLIVTADRDEAGALLGTPEYRLVSVKCDCGKLKTVSARGLRKGHTRSCGCLHAETVVLHGLDWHPLSNIWRGMIARCEKPETESFRYYGARGIKVCQQWRNDLPGFIAWAENAGWAKGLQIDRIDTNGNYCPENCRFVDAKTNQNNKRSNRVICINGVSMTLADASRQFGIEYSKLQQRIHKLGWKPEDAVAA